MNIVEEIKEIINKLNKIDDYNATLSQRLNILDEKTQDILHYIENNKISAFACYRIIKELRTLRQERRKVKQDIELSRTYDEHKNKLSSKNNRQFLIQELSVKNKHLQTQYKNRQYTEEDLQNIMK